MIKIVKALRVRDAEGKFLPLVAIKGEKGDKGDGAQIETGSYVGTGNKDTNRVPVVISFSFVPKMVYIYTSNPIFNYPAGLNPTCAVWFEGMSKELGGNSDSYRIYELNTEDKTLSVYSEYKYNQGMGAMTDDTNPELQMNTKDKQYYWVAIG